MNEKQNDKKSRLFGIVSKALTAVFLLVFLFSGYQIISYFLEGKEESDLNEEMIREAVNFVKEDPIYAEESLTSEDKQTDEPEEKKILYYPDISVDVKKLSQEFEGIVGWLYLPETPIHYPVMQWTDNDYFVHRLPNGNENSAGSIFMDFRVNPDLSGRNYILYGHNMKNDSMFGTVLEYRDPAFFKDHPYLFYFTEDGVFRLEIFAGVHTTADSYVYSFPSDDEEIGTYLSKIRSSSVFLSDVAVSKEDRIFILSTCSGRVGDDQRFILCAKLVPLEP